MQTLGDNGMKRNAPGKLHHFMMGKHPFEMKEDYSCALRIMQSGEIKISSFKTSNKQDIYLDLFL